MTARDAFIAVPGSFSIYFDRPTVGWVFWPLQPSPILYCVGGDFKHCWINQSTIAVPIWQQWASKG